MKVGSLEFSLEQERYERALECTTLEYVCVSNPRLWLTSRLSKWQVENGNGETISTREDNPEKAIDQAIKYLELESAYIQSLLDTLKEGRK